MATTSILSSPFLTHNILDTLLSQSPSLADKINLLSAKIHLYANPSIASSFSNDAPAKGPTRESPRSGDRDRARTEEMKARMEVGGLWLEMGAEGDRSGCTKAEAELSLITDWAKGALKGIQRRKREKAKRDDGIGIDQKRHETGLGGTMAMGDETVKDEVQDVTIDEGPWEEEVRSMKREAEELMVRVQVGLGREDRAGRFRRQIAESDRAVPGR